MFEGLFEQGAGCVKAAFGMARQRVHRDDLALAQMREGDREAQSGTIMEHDGRGAANAKPFLAQFAFFYYGEAAAVAIVQMRERRKIDLGFPGEVEHCIPCPYVAPLCKKSPSDTQVKILDCLGHYL